MTMTGGIMRMHAVTDGLGIGAGATARFNPDSYHLMFISPKRRLASGDAVPVTLTFAHAGAVTARFSVQPTAPVGMNAPPRVSGMAPM